MGEGSGTGRTLNYQTFLLFVSAKFDFFWPWVLGKSHIEHHQELDGGSAAGIQVSSLHMRHNLNSLKRWGGIRGLHNQQL